MTPIMKTAKAEAPSRRERIVRDAATRLGRNMDVVAKEMGLSPQGLLSILRSPRPRNKTLGRLLNWCRRNGVTMHGKPIEMQHLS